MDSTAEINSAELELKPEQKASTKASPLKKLSVLQLLNLCIGFIGIQFAWSMQIGLSGRVTEPLGATPLIYGLIWLAGPITGILVQPIIGVISDNSWTMIGRRHPFILIGMILGCLGLFAFPNSSVIANHLGWISPLLFAASFLWIIDACVNITQGPYRALVPDVAPPEQHAIANSFLSFAIGAGSVIAFGAAPFIKAVFGIQMTIPQQFMMAIVAFVVTILWTVFTTPERQKPQKVVTNTESPLEPIINFAVSAAIALVITTVIFKVGNYNLSSRDSIVQLLSYFVLILSVPMLFKALISFKSKEAWKLCAMQFFTWLGIMCMFIYFNNFVVHNIFSVPDLATASAAIKAKFAAAEITATNVSSTAYAIFNAVCLLASIPLGIICNKLGKKNVHTFALAAMAAAFLGLGLFAKTTPMVLAFMGLAGIGWASVLSLPFALLTDHIVKGTEGSAMGKFNLFIAGPQILSSVAIGYLINKSPMQISTGQTYHWEYAFIAAGIAVLIAAVITQTVKESR